MEESYLAPLAVEGLIRIFLHVKQSSAFVQSGTLTEFMLQTQPIVSPRSVRPPVDHPVAQILFPGKRRSSGLQVATPIAAIGDTQCGFKLFPRPSLPYCIKRKNCI